MNGSHNAVVVGIDGSPVGINAAKWAVAEAIARGTTLRLVHVVNPKDSPNAFREERGPEALRLAECAARRHRHTSQR